MDNEVKEILVKILREIKGDQLNESTLTEDSHLLTDVGLSSLDMMRFLLSVEDEFDIEVDIEEMEISIFDSMKAMGAFIQSSLSEA